ncbi:MAG: NDP-sugar synthase [Bryobacteraceae bacterium]|nr:NDP-sugar synthase [Bryobacteraceae bacterium]
MRALIIAAGYPSPLDALGSQWPSPMLPAGDRPMVQHVLEQVIVAGCRQVDVVLGEAAERVEHHLGDGQRWGCRIRYHLTSGYERAAATVAAVARQGESFLLAQADLLPQADLRSLPEDRAVRFDLEKAAPAGHTVAGPWTGWAWIPGALAAATPNFTDWAGVGAWLEELARSGACEVRHATPGLTSRDGKAWLASQTTALTTLAESLHFSAFPSDPGIWLGRNVSLPPSVALIAPVLVGDNSQVGEGVTLGPGAVICSSCVIDDRTTVVESVILDGSYVGRDLDVHGSVINRSKLLNVRLGASVVVTDAFLLGGISGDAGRPRSFADVAANLAGRVLLVPLALLLLPPLLLLRLIAGRWPVVRQLRFVRTPAAPDSVWEESSALCCLTQEEARQADGWRHFWLVVIPGILAVIQGRLTLVGPLLRTADQLRALPEDWRSFCLQCKPGLISECFVLHGPAAEEDLWFTSDAMHAATANWHTSMRTAGRYAMLLALGRPDTVESGVLRRSG